MSFAHLHVHTTYSFLDGASRVDRLVRRAKEHGFPSLAVTDHGFLHAWPEFQLSCDKEGIQAILGVEAYIVDDLPKIYRDQKLPKGTPARKEANALLRSPCHQLLLAMNDEGVRNITKLVSHAAAHQMHYRRPVIDLAQLEAHSEGVIATSSCMSGLIPRAIRAGDTARVDRLMKWFQRVFDDRFYLEVHDHGIKEEGVIRDAIFDLGPRYGVPVICANDVHYVDRDDYEVQQMLTSIAMNRRLDDGGGEYAHDRLHLATEGEMSTLFGKQFPKSLDNTLDLASRCTGSLPFGRGYVLPDFQQPDEYQSPLEYIADLCRQRVAHLYSADMFDAARDRLAYELGMLDKMQTERGVDFASYFLITADMTNFARKEGIWVGPGRGSAAGSIVSYLLGITNIDPLRFDLLFERFINPERVSMPDIDLDFSRQEPVFEYLRQKYGEESVMRIVTFGRMGSKSAVRDMARILGVSISESDRLSEKVPADPGEKEFSSVFMKDPYVLGKAKKDDRVATILDMGPRVFGLTKQTGVHACGVVVTPGPVTDYMPICSVKARGSKSSQLVTQFEGGHIEALGLLKLDVLGLSTGAIIQETIDLVKQTRDLDVDVDTIPLDDPTTFALYQRGDTDATFQFESQGMKDWLVKLQPHTIDDLVAMVALYRPGPMKLIPRYVARKNGAERVEYPHPALKESLESTYGIAVYQEQVMQMARVMAGFSLGEADLLRKAIGKKKIKELEAMHRKFVQGCMDVHGMSEYQSEKLFDLIKEFADYGFNRSHAAAYAMIAYQTGYLKANFPVEYMTIVVQHNASDMTKKAKYLQTCQNMGISVLPPDVNESRGGFFANPSRNAIFYGLGAVKGVGEAATSIIMEERAENGEFLDLKDFIHRISLNPEARVTSGDIGALIRVGAFDAMGERNYLLWQMEHLLKWASKMRDYERGRRSKEMGGSWGNHRKSVPDFDKPDPGDAPLPMTFEEKLRFEMQYLGQFISGHPMDGFGAVNGMIQQITGAAPNQEKPAFFQVGRKSVTSYVGYVITTEEKRIKRGDNTGKAFLIAHLLVGDRVVEAVAWPETYSRYAFLLAPDERVWVVASNRGNSVVIETVIDLREVIADWSQGIQLKLDGPALTDALDAMGFAHGDQWTFLESEGTVYKGPDIALSPEKLRKLASFGDVTMF